MKDFQRPFIPGGYSGSQLALSRFLPPLPSGMVQAWLKENVPAGEYIIDPLCATPALALEAARAGYRVLVASNNPILSFMLEILASAPTIQDFQSVLSELASSRKGDERLEIHLQSLYLTECTVCGRPIQAQAYLWRKGENQPYARLYRCPYCGDEGERTITSFDLSRLAIPGNASLHRARALERVSQPGDSLREGVEEALQTYLVRPIYFLFTLINKIEGLGLPPEKRRLLSALALTVCDEANSLWPHPSGRLRPRQLTMPTQFRENNLWIGLENAIQNWTFQLGPIPFSTWPFSEIPPGGIGLFQGRLRTILPLPPAVQPAAAVIVLPRPNQAYWTLSALWSGWLWGREAVQPLRSALERRRYDWHWHATALYHALSPLTKFARASLPVFGLIPELVPGFYSAAVLASEAAGIQLEQIALQADEEIVQITWKSETNQKSKAGLSSWESAIEKGTVNLLAMRNEPAPFLPIHVAALTGLAVSEALPFNQAQFDDEILTRIQNSIQKVLSNPAIFVRYDSRPQNPESGLWWLANPPQDLELPLADRIEMEIVRFMQKKPGRTLAELETALYALFPGILTPSTELIRICLQSYGDASSTLPEHWQLRLQESPAARRADLSAAHSGLDILASNLGFQAQGENPVLWMDPKGKETFCFYLSASGIISKYLFNPGIISPARSILVLPGSRANLVAYKIHHDPRLSACMVEGWRFLKFRLLRQLLDRKNLNLPVFEEMLQSDPPRWEEEATQMSIFPAI
jgi:hypothetical protein